MEILKLKEFKKAQIITQTINNKYFASKMINFRFILSIYLIKNKQIDFIV